MPCALLIILWLFQIGFRSATNVAGRTITQETHKKIFMLTRHTLTYKTKIGTIIFFPGTVNSVLALQGQIEGNKLYKGNSNYILKAGPGHKKHQFFLFTHHLHP